MIPAHAATQKTRRPAMCRSYRGFAARRWRMHERDPATRGRRSRGRATSVPSFGHGREVDREDQRADEQRPKGRRRGCRPARSPRSRERAPGAGPGPAPRPASGNVIRKTDPHQKCSSRRPENIGPRAATAPPIPDHSAIDFVRWGPDQSAVISASVVGNAIPADNPPPSRATNSTVSLGAYAASSATRDRQGRPEDQHELAAVPVAERAEPQHGGREPEGIAHGDEVQRRLGRVERRPDRRQGDVGDREVQVGDRRDQDQGGEHEPRTLGNPRRCPGRAAVPRALFPHPLRSPSSVPLTSSCIRARAASFGTGEPGGGFVR